MMKFTLTFENCRPKTQKMESKTLNLGTNNHIYFRTIKYKHFMHSLVSQGLKRANCPYK